MNDFLCLCGLLKASAAACERELNEAIVEMGISHCQAMILIKISDSDGMTMSAISKELCCHKSNVTQVVDGLASKELIERQISKEDRRLCILTLTKKGIALSAKAKVLLEHRAEKCFSKLPRKDLETLESILKEMLKK